MISLTLTILFTVSLFIFFKEFDKRNINTHQAITFNYFTAAVLATLLYNKTKNRLIRRNINVKNDVML